jgi:hypothetical protein
MIAFVMALGFVLISFGIHVALWRARLPRHPVRDLLLIFALVPVGLGSLICLLGQSRSWAALPFSDWTGIVLFQAGAALSYLVIYTGIEETSPSLAIIRALSSAPGLGRTREELALVITEDRFVRPRLLGLRRGNFLAPAPGGDRLTPSGRRIARLATLFQVIFNLHDSA